MRLIYTANARFPSEKAHPYQIMQMCEAFAENGAEVKLIRPTRYNSPELRTADVWGFYGVKRNFAMQTLPTMDLFPIANRIPGKVGRRLISIASALATLTFNIALLFRLMSERNAVIYSRDPMTLAWIAAIWPRRAKRAFFEAHTYPATGIGLRIRQWLAPRIGGFVVITGHLHERYCKLGIPPERIIIAHDGFRAERFQLDQDRAACRDQVGWPQQDFIVGYMGRFHTLGMDKGLGDLLEAVIALAGDQADRQVRLGLIGGPDSYVDIVRKRVAEAGLSPDLILYAGQVPAANVPAYLRAFDVCTMAFPWTEHFAYYASPMKLFEYMASGSPIVATNLPSTTEVLRDGENGLLTPPSDPTALADALRQLRDTPGLSQRLADAALADVQHYTWHARANQLCAFMQQNR